MIIHLFGVPDSHPIRVTQRRHDVQHEEINWWSSLNEAPIEVCDFGGLAVNSSKPQELMIKT